MPICMPNEALGQVGQAGRGCISEKPGDSEELKCLPIRGGGYRPQLPPLGLEERELTCLWDSLLCSITTAL